MTSQRHPTFFKTPAAFRRWLARHHGEEAELLIGFYKKDSGKGGITYPEALDEALCYGWIDGVRRPINDESYVIRFTPRNPQSIWSGRNIERVEELKAEGRMRKAGLDAYAHKGVHRDSGYAVSDWPEALPKKMVAEFQKHREAWAFYQSQPSGYRKQTTVWVTSAKREETRQRRLATLIDDSANGLRIKQLRREQPAR